LVLNATGIIKFDLNAEPEVGGNIHGLYDLGQRTFCSDPIYIPRVPETDSEEDDGYLIFFVHDENTRYQILYISDYDMI